MLSRETIADPWAACGIREDVCAACDRDLVTVVRDGVIARTDVGASVSGEPICKLCAADAARTKHQRGAQAGGRAIDEPVRGMGVAQGPERCATRTLGGDGEIDHDHIAAAPGATNHDPAASPRHARPRGA